MFQIDQDMVLDFDLTNMNGNSVQAIRTNTFQKGSHEMVLPIGGLPNGVYVLTLSGNGIKVTEKFVVGR